MALWLRRAEEADDWTYRGEGAANIVLGYAGSSPAFVGKVLRVRKASKTDGVAAQAAEGAPVLSAQEQLLWKDVDGLAGCTSEEVAGQLFALHVMSPLLGPQHVDPGAHVLVSKEFLQSVEKNILDQRPSWRVDAAKVNTSCDSALLMSDHSFFPHGDLKESACIAVEIKPKCGFLPLSKFIRRENVVKTSVTRFKMHQTLKLHEGQHKPWRHGYRDHNSQTNQPQQLHPVISCCGAATAGYCGYSGSQDHEKAVVVSTASNGCIWQFSIVVHHDRPCLGPSQSLLATVTLAACRRSCDLPPRRSAVLSQCECGHFLSFSVLRADFVFVIGMDFIGHSFLASLRSRGFLSLAMISRISEYDPLDLFSGSRDRIRKAIMGLFHCPQNNFRVFFNGSLAFGVLGGMMEKSEISTDETCKQNEAFENMLKAVILTENGQCLMSFLELVGEAIFTSEIMAHLLEVQKLDLLDIEGAIHAYYNIISQPCLVCKNLSDDELLNRCSSLHSLTLEESLEIVKTYLIAATAKDCSLMICFKPRGEIVASDNGSVYLKSTNQTFDYKNHIKDEELTTHSEEEPRMTKWKNAFVAAPLAAHSRNGLRTLFCGREHSVKGSGAFVKCAFSVTFHVGRSSTPLAWMEKSGRVAGSAPADPDPSRAGVGLSRAESG
ncbi:hypothetical protein Taro_018640 [Colocasia esculenta]|uniref:inositol-pentakisphosphate 2-kinase n=1 Tax=Colocasia esculenta TaxID=4460 RepID=A0A843UUG4_COLES|nr:hypothetical protein [Colocasia esculenta]